MSNDNDLSLPASDLLSTQIAPLFTALDDTSAQSLASILSNATTQSDLDTTLHAIISHFLLISKLEPSKVDAFLRFLLITTPSHFPPSFVATNHPGRSITPTEGTYRLAFLKPSTGGQGMLLEKLSQELFEHIWGSVSRAYTPDEEDDRVKWTGEPSPLGEGIWDPDTHKEYTVNACVYSVVLARAFALVVSEGLMSGAENGGGGGEKTIPLWREVEDVFVKGLFSGESQEPGAFVALSALLLGAGKEIKKAFDDGKVVGKGKKWLWYDDVRTDPDVVWGWRDVVGGLRDQPGGEMEEVLPREVKVAFELAKLHIGEEGTDFGGSWSSKRLVEEAFGFVLAPPQQ